MPDQFDPDFPARYRKLPVTVEAIRYTPGTNCIAVAGFLGDSPDDLTCAEEADHEQTQYAIATLEGVMHASPGDYIIRGVHGEHYPCKPDIFEATYERPDTPVIPDQNPGKPSMEDLAAEIRLAFRSAYDVGVDDPAEAAARAVLALIPPQRCAPSEDAVTKLIMSCAGGVATLNESRVASAMAHAIRALHGDQPTAEEAKAEALRDAATELDRDAAEGRAARRAASVRCLRCGLRHEEREEYSCQIEGTAHDYDDAELAEAAQLDGETSWIGDRLRARAAAIESGAEHG